MTVYYLPTRGPLTNETPEVPAAPSPWSVLRARTSRAWWRLRVTASEVCAVIRRGGARNPFEDHIWFAPEPPAPRARAVGPARIIDLEAARSTHTGGARRAPQAPRAPRPG
jgi:hypothetical protein